MWSKIKVGDTITFTTINRAGKQKAKRKVVEVGPLGIGVRFGGWDPYYLGNRRLDKVISIQKAPPLTNQ